MDFVAILKALGANPQMVSALTEAQKLAVQYGSSKEGMLKAVQEHGGIPALNEAMKYIDNPLVVTALNTMGVNVNELKVMAESLKGNAQPSRTLNAPIHNTVVDDLQQRLNKLKR